MEELMPNRALHRTHNQRRFACRFRADEGIRWTSEDFLMSALNYVVLFVLLAAHAVAAAERAHANDGKYVRAFSYCRDINSYLVTPPEWGKQYPQQQSASHSFSPIPDAMLKMWKFKGNIFYRKRLRK